MFFKIEIEIAIDAFRSINEHLFLTAQPRAESLQ